jgi:Transposase IS116/IS110/IS902 family
MGAFLFLELMPRGLNWKLFVRLDRNPHLKQQRELLTSIPGIGDLTAPILLAEIGDISDYDNARQLAAYAGLTPSVNVASGTSVKRVIQPSFGRSLLCRRERQQSLVSVYSLICIAFRQRSLPLLMDVHKLRLDRTLSGLLSLNSS